MTMSTKAYKYDLGREVQALRKIQGSVHVDERIDIWRYATGIGEREKQSEFYPQGWVLQRDL
jgi:hypothetical protein